MSWSSGSALFARIAEVIESVISNEDDRAALYEEMIVAFEEFDCDTLHECTDIDPVLDELLGATDEDTELEE